LTALHLRRETGRKGEVIHMEARDYIAIVTILCGMILLALEIDSLVGAILIAVISYYFGMRSEGGCRDEGPARPARHPG
jgi:hypothetical protein